MGRGADGQIVTNKLEYSPHVGGNWRETQDKRSPVSVESVWSEGERFGKELVLPNLFVTFKLFCRESFRKKAERQLGSKSNAHGAI